MEITLQQISWFAASIGALAASVGAILATLTYRTTQKWLQLRFANEVVEKLYSDDSLRLAIQFLDWHDREIFLPEKYAHYVTAGPHFAHKIANMAVAMSVDSREYDPVTRVYDLKVEFRKPQYELYVEVFDQFFDYLSQVHTFCDASLLRNEQIPSIVYNVRRLDALNIFNSYLEKYEVHDVLKLIRRFKKPSYPWVGRDKPGP